MELNAAVTPVLEDEAKKAWTDIDVAVKNHAVEEILVNIGDFAIGDTSVVLICLGLGSCVGVILYDSNTKLAGLAHVMLPSKSMASYNSESHIGRFADTAIPYVIDLLIKRGCLKSNLRAKIAGGAQMFKSNNEELFDIGKRNIDMVKEQLSINNIPVVSQDILGCEGRTLRFIVGESKALVRTKSRLFEL